MDTKLKYKIISNKARCDECGETIESKHRHDFVTCKCGNLHVDGGRDYLKRGFKSNKYTDFSEVIPDIKVIF